MVEKIKVLLKELDPGELGFDIEVNEDEDPTVQDYLDVMNKFQEEKMASCGTCTGCCWERVPLTYQDMVKYMELLGTGKENENSYKDGKTRPVFKKPGSVKEFIENYCTVINEKGVVDIILKRKKDDSYIFLDNNNNRCGAWSARGFICQSYICLPSGKKARDLRQKIVNAGEDMLVEEAGFDPGSITENKPKTYKELYLKDIL